MAIEEARAALSKVISDYTKANAEYERELANVGGDFAMMLGAGVTGSDDDSGLTVDGSAPPGAPAGAPRAFVPGRGSAPAGAPAGAPKVVTDHGFGPATAKKGGQVGNGEGSKKPTFGAPSKRQEPQFRRLRLPPQRVLPKQLRQLGVPPKLEPQLRPLSIPPKQQFPRPSAKATKKAKLSAHASKTERESICIAANKGTIGKHERWAAFALTRF